MGLTLVWMPKVDIRVCRGRCALYVQARPGSVALVVACEPITHGMAASNDLDFVTNLALLRMGAAAVLLTNRSAAQGPRLFKRALSCPAERRQGIVRDAVSAWLVSPQPLLLLRLGFHGQKPKNPTDSQEFGHKRAPKARQAQVAVRGARSLRHIAACNVMRWGGSKQGPKRSQICSMQGRAKPN